MLEVQKYFREHGPKALQENFDISTTVSPCGNLGILNYGLKSTKTHPYTLESRSLVLELSTGNIVAKTFNRFFNLGECEDIHKNFNWDNFITEEKTDGSLCYVFYYNGWKVNTRSSFAQGLIEGFGGTWQDLFIKAGGDKVFDYVDRKDLTDFTFVFELGSPYTKVVKYHPKPTLFLLTVVNNKTLEEPFDYIQLDSLAALLGVERPKIYLFNSLNDILAHIDTLDPTDEGFVIKDSNGMRIKIKNKSYLVLHALKGNNNLFLIKYLVPLLFTKVADKDEVLSYFPEVKEKLDLVESHVNKFKEETKILWEGNKGRGQKEFALSVKDSPYSWFLFNLYKGRDYDSSFCSLQTEKWMVEYLKRKGIQ